MWMNLDIYIKVSFLDASKSYPTGFIFYVGIYERQYKLPEEYKPKPIQRIRGEGENSR